MSAIPPPPAEPPRPASAPGPSPHGTTPSEAPASSEAPRETPDVPELPESRVHHHEHEHDRGRTPRRPRGRTALLLACAALLGTVGGVAGGYTVQADRAPTPLPPLAQAKLSYPEKPLAEGEGREPLTAEEDRRLRTDGDLRELLLEEPEGARENEAYTDDGWLSPAAYAEGFEEPGHMFAHLTEERELRRIAATSWEEGRYRTVEIGLLQFREEYQRAAIAFVEDQQSYMPDGEHAGNPGKPLKGSGNGRFYVYDEPLREPGYPPLYQARAIAQRGDIAMDVWVCDTEPIGERTIRVLAERQLERL